MARRSALRRGLPRLNPIAQVQGTTAYVASLPAPVGGWNARDSLANMPIEDAVTLQNWFPGVSNCVLRGGYTQYSTGLSGQVESLFNYSGGNTQKLWAVTSSGRLYDVSSAGAVGAPAVTGLTNGRWQSQNVTTSGGSYLYAVNGADSALIYDGSSWQAVTGVSAPVAITGVTTSTLSNVTLFKTRVWFIQKNTLKAWYLPSGAVGGAAQVLDMSSFARLGGYLVGMMTWTVDGGYGMDDNLAFITSNGEIIVWRGTDPSSAATWAMAGIWALGEPVGSRCMLKYGGDVLTLTQNGLFPLSQALQSTQVDFSQALSDKIQGAFSTATATYGSTFGWQIFYCPKQNAIWVNVPFAVGSQQQFVMNTITKAWCNFSGWAANCWCLFGEEPFFGGNGFVGQAWDSTYADNGTDIATNGLQAFNYFKARGVEKIFTRARPTLFTNGQPSVLVGINVNFDVSDTTSALTYTPSSAGLWDSGLWDVAVWGSGLVATANWQGVTGTGYCGAVNLKSASQGIQIEWSSTDVVYQQGWAGI
jgi:hypothetical protein